jgi:hypothetical protein
MQIRKRIIAALSAVALATTGIGAAALSAQAAEPDGSDWLTRWSAEDWDHAFRTTITNTETGETGFDAGAWVGNGVRNYIPASPLEVHLADYPATVSVQWQLALNLDSTKWNWARFNGGTTTYVPAGFVEITPPICDAPPANASTGIVVRTCTATYTVDAPLGDLITDGTADYYSFGVPQLSNTLQQSANGTAWVGGGTATAFGASIHTTVDAAPVVPAIFPAAQSHLGQVGEPLTIDLALLAGNCTMSDATTCAPNEIEFSSVPAGATVDNTSFTWTPANTGDVTFSFVLRNSATGASSIVTSQTISVFASPSILPAPQSYDAVVGTPITLDLGIIADDCMMTDASTCDPDGITFLATPDSSTVSGESFEWTPDAAGIVEFEFILTDSSTGATSLPAIGTITATATPVVESHINGISQTYTVKVGESITVTSTMLAEGATNSSDGSPVIAANTDGEALVFAEFTVVPVGGTVGDLDPNGTKLDFSSLAPGTYAMVYTLDYVSKEPNPSGSITSYIVVTPLNVPKPVVTG